MLSILRKPTILSSVRGLILWNRLKIKFCIVLYCILIMWSSTCVVSIDNRTWEWSVWFEIPRSGWIHSSIIFCRWIVESHCNRIHSSFTVDYCVKVVISEDFRLYLRGQISAPFPIQKSIHFSQFSDFFSQFYTIKKKWPWTSYSTLLSQYTK